MELQDISYRLYYPTVGSRNPICALQGPMNCAEMPDLTVTFPNLPPRLTGAACCDIASSYTLDLTTRESIAVYGRASIRYAAWGPVIYCWLSSKLQLPVTLTYSTLQGYEWPVCWKFHLRHEVGSVVVYALRVHIHVRCTHFRSTFSYRNENKWWRYWKYEHQLVARLATNVVLTYWRQQAANPGTFSTSYNLCFWLIRDFTG